MCNRYRLSAKQAAVMRACGFESPYPEDENHPVPREIFPTGKKTGGVAWSCGNRRKETNRWNLSQWNGAYRHFTPKGEIRPDSEKLPARKLAR